MIRFSTSLLGLTFLLCAPAFCADPPTIGQVLDTQFLIWDHEISSAVEAMPADKFDFAPTAGEFKGARTFGQQAKHLAAVMYQFSAACSVKRRPRISAISTKAPSRCGPKRKSSRR